MCTFARVALGGVGVSSSRDVLPSIALQGKLDEAEILYRCSMTITEETLGKEHPYYGQIVNNLALLLEKQVSSRGRRTVSVCVRVL